MSEMALFLLFCCQVCCNVLTIRHIQNPADGILALIDCTDWLLGHYAYFFCGEVGLKEAAQLDFFFIQNVSESFYKWCVESVIDIVHCLIEVFPVQEGIDIDFLAGLVFMWLSCPVHYCYKIPSVGDRIFARWSGCTEFVFRREIICICGNDGYETDSEEYCSDSCLCEKHKVHSLYVFGSVLTDRFNDDSDIDLW